MTNPNFSPSEQPNDWDVQRKLTGELQALTAAGASQEEIASKADEINRNVATLVDSGEVHSEDAWALGAGDNPYVENPGSQDL